MNDFNKLKRHELWHISKLFKDNPFDKYTNTTKINMVNFLNKKHKKLIGGKLDIQKFLSKTFPDTEFHLPGYNFCGPGTKLSKRLKNFDKETGEHDEFITKPINELDKGCYEHDINYTKHDKLKDRHDDDRKLIKVANKVLNNKKSTIGQKISAGLVKHLLQAKVAFGGCENCNKKHIEALINTIRQDF